MKIGMNDRERGGYLVNMGDMAEWIAFFIRVLVPVVGLAAVFLSFASLKESRRKEHALVVLENEQDQISYPVLYWENSIGRSRSSDIRIGDPTVSRDHAVLLRRSDGWFIADTESRAGVLVNGEKTAGRCRLALGDEITLGSTKLTLRRATAGEGQATAGRKYIPSAILLGLVTLYMVLMGTETVINMGNGHAAGPVVCFIGVCWLFYGVSRLVFKRPNFELEALALLLSGTGIVMAAAHSDKQGWMQLAALIVGIVLYFFMIWFIEIPDRVMKWHLILSIFTLLLLASSIVLGSVLNGAKNWILIGPISVQPSEFAKIAYVFAGASTLDVLQTKKSLTQFIIISALSVGLLIFMSDFGTAVIFFVTFLIIAFMRSGDVKTVFLALTAAGMGALLMLNVKPYIADRFKAWGHVWEYASDEGYQQVNSLVYSASGGLFGVGSSKGYLQYLFASENDLVFCLICEEAGCLLALLMAVVIGGFMIYARGVATRSRSTFYSITACSAGGLLVFQAALNIFGVVDLLPLTGVTLPFVSYGGSSMAACWGLLAFIKAADERTYAMRSSGKKKSLKKRKKQPDYVEI